MSAFSNAFETALLGLLFTNTNAANVGDATGLRGSTGAGSFHFGLHSSSPGEAGDQTTNEISYTGYGRVAVARAGAQWTVAGDTVDNDNAITFGACTAGSDTASHVSVGSDASGVGNLFMLGAVGSSLAISSGVTPEFAAGAFDFTLD